MSTPILAAKLYPPPPRPQLVPRPRLFERLHQGLQLRRKLTLISAAAGFGKTTLLGEWLASCERSVAWLSLDESDNEPERFLAYLIAALQTVIPHVGKRVLAELHSPQSPPTEAILTDLLNEIATVPDELIMVLDDYHLIDSPQIDETLAFLLEHLPPHMHLVIATREDPQLPLPRLRARRQMTELRANDLRFTAEEAAAFLNEVMNLNLSAEEIASLEMRTEGWIAGLQLAALSMSERDDVSAFIAAFAGDHRYIVDYLVEEVLQRQPPPVRSFLLRTSILDRLSGSLCDALVGRPEIGDWGLATGIEVTAESPGQKMLEFLERGNLFVVPLDDRRQWYRYHHLFADVLQTRLMEDQPGQMATLHRRAGDWYHENGSPAEAIRHAFAAEDVERAAAFVELAWSEMDKNRQSAAWLRWAGALPHELVRARPVLSAGYAWALLDSGELEAGEARLRDAERWLDKATNVDERPQMTIDGMVVVDEEEFRSLPGTIASARAYLAQAHGDLSGAIDYARRALDHLPQEDHLRRGIPASILGLAAWAEGDLETAHRSFAQAMTSFEKAGNVLFAITGAYILADIRLAQGRLRDALRTYERSLQMAADQGQPPMRGTADLYLGLSEMHCERGDLQAATENLLKSEALSEHAALPRWQYRWCLAQARIKEARGDLDDALKLLDEAERLYLRGPVPDMRPIPALKARVWARQGNLAPALAWASEHGLSPDDELSYMREFEHLTLARVLLAQYERDHEEQTIQQALDLIQRLLLAAQAGDRQGSMIEILLLQALARQAQGDTSAALASLQRALTLAEPQGYVRTFTVEGSPLARLLDEANRRGIMPHYTNKLRAAFEIGAQTSDAIRKTPPDQPLVEPLSPRELEVLQLLAQGLSNRQIGQRLYLALSTVKGHNRNIYAKLQVRRRTEAVARARQLGLLAS